MPIHFSSDCRRSRGLTHIIVEKTQARQLVKAAMLEAGLEVREDPMGNIFGRLAGSQPGLGAVGSGSHTDAIPHAGESGVMSCS